MKNNKSDKSQKTFREETGNTECFVCENFEKKIITKEVFINGQRVLLENVEVEVCLKCGAIYYDGQTINLAAKSLAESKTDNKNEI